MLIGTFTLLGADRIVSSYVEESLCAAYYSYTLIIVLRWVIDHLVLDTVTYTRVETSVHHD